MTCLRQVLDEAIQRGIDRVSAALRKLPACCPMARSVSIFPSMRVRTDRGLESFAEDKFIQNRE